MCDVLQSRAKQLDACEPDQYIYIVTKVTIPTSGDINVMHPWALPEHAV